MVYFSSRMVQKRRQRKYYCFLISPISSARKALSECPTKRSTYSSNRQKHQTPQASVKTCPKKLYAGSASTSMPSAHGECDCVSFDPLTFCCEEVVRRQRKEVC